MGFLDNIDWGMIASGMPTPGADDPMAQLQRRWPTPGMTAETMPTMAQSPISPEVLAQHAAARGVPPPPVDLPVGSALTGTGLPGDTPFRMPDQGAVEDWRRGTPGPEVFNKGSGTDMTRTPGAPSAPVTPAGAPAPSTEMSSQNKPGAEKQVPTLSDTLKGVKAPAGPELQKLGTPAAPKPSAIGAPQLLALLQSLNVGGQGAAPQLPSTLGQALLGRK